MTINGSTNVSNWTFKLEAYEIGTYSIENNTSTVRVDMYLGRSGSQSYIGTNWNGSITVDGQTQYLSGNIPYPTYINAGAWLYLGTRDYTITHNTDGSKVASISADWYSEAGVSPSSAWASGNLTLTTIPRASTVTATNADIGSATSININRASSSFKHTLKYRFGSLSGTIATNVDTTYGWTIPTTFYAEIPNAKTGTCTITCETYSGSTLIGTKTTTFTITANENLCKPTLIGSVVDTNQTTLDLTGDGSILVKYYSTASITYMPTARNGASIVETQINNQVVSSSPHVITNIDTNQIIITTTDSRGYSTTLTLTPPIINYIPLTMNATFYRTAPTTGEVSLTFTGNYFNGDFGVELNTLSLTWYYKLKDSQSWDAGGTLILNTDYKIIENTYHSGDTNYEQPISLGYIFNYQNQYDFKIEFTDKLETHEIIQTVSKGVPIINWDDDHFNVNGEITQYEQPFIPSYCVATITNSQSISSSYVVNLNQIERSQGNFTLENGYIKIGSGISKVRVSASIFVDSWSGGSSYLWGRIFKNTDDVGNSIVSGPARYISSSIPSTIVDVSEGDNIKLMADSGSGGSLRTGANNTWLCVEKVE